MGQPLFLAGVVRLGESFSGPRGIAAWRQRCATYTRPAPFVQKIRAACEISRYNATLSNLPRIDGTKGGSCARALNPLRKLLIRDKRGEEYREIFFFFFFFMALLEIIEGDREANVASRESFPEDYLEKGLTFIII